MLDWSFVAHLCWSMATAPAICCDQALIHPCISAVVPLPSWLAIASTYCCRAVGSLITIRHCWPGGCGGGSSHQ